MRLSWTTTNAPDMGGFRFYVEYGDVFDADEYANVYGLNRHDIDHNDIANAQAAASNLSPGEWLEVTHFCAERAP